MPAEPSRPAEPRPPWYERFGSITSNEPKEGIPVPAGGTFQGRPPPTIRRAFDEDLEERWSEDSRCDRRAEVTEVDWLTRTGTLRLGFEVTDGRPFSFAPGNFVRIERHVAGKGFRRGTYCIASPPSEYHRFDLHVRVVQGGRMSEYLAMLRLGDEVAFRGPTGRSMVKIAGDHDAVLMATGVGVAPLYALASYLLRSGFHRRIDLYWGLRTTDDVCLTAQLDRLADAYQNFRYRISLSRPPAGLGGPNARDGWADLSGRLTESVPPLLANVGDADRRYILTGNGAMIAEMAAALYERGVPSEAVYQEAYFNGRHVPGPKVVAAIARRFATGIPDR